MKSTTKRLLSERGSNGDIAFPWKLHNVLEASEEKGFKEIISWEGDKAFKVHDPKRFEDHIMKQYFNSTQYKSFQRQINIYGFTRVIAGDGGSVGSYVHPFFLRGKPHLCRFMVRTKVKKRGSRRKPSICVPRTTKSFREDPVVGGDSNPNSRMSALEIVDGQRVSFCDPMQKMESQNGGMFRSPLERLLFASDTPVKPLVTNCNSHDSGILTNYPHSLPSISPITMNFTNERNLTPCFPEVKIASDSNLIQDSNSQFQKETQNAVIEDTPGFDRKIVFDTSFVPIETYGDIYENVEGHSQPSSFEVEENQTENLRYDEFRKLQNLTTRVQKDPSRGSQFQAIHNNGSSLELPNTLLTKQKQCIDPHSKANCQWEISTFEDDRENASNFWRSISGMDLDPTPISTFGQLRFHSDRYATPSHGMVRRISFVQTS